MKSTLRKVLSVALVVPAMAFAVFGMAVPASAAEISNCSGLPGAEAAKCGTCVATPGSTWVTGSGTNGGHCDAKGTQTDLNAIIGIVINTMLIIIGVLCVVFIIWGGFTYTMSRGKDDKVKDAKNTILYAVVGLIIALISFALVNWVLDIF